MSNFESIQVMRMIGRLSVGGAAAQAIALTRLLDSPYRTTLVTGVASQGEEEMTALLEGAGIVPVRLPELRRQVGFQDARALASVRVVIRDLRPVVLHTHAAKGGAIGRLAAASLYGQRPPIIIHTYHGHVLRDYFSPLKEQLYRAVERTLATQTTCLVVVAPEVRDELLDLGVGRPEQYRVIPDGFELDAFCADSVRESLVREDTRRSLGVTEEETLIMLMARLVPIKRVDRFLRIAARLTDAPNLRFVVVGDGELGGPLRDTAAALGIDRRVIWTGFRTDVPELCFASDVVALTSDNEGAPSSLIEAQAAGRPVVATDVGGTRSVVADGESGYVVGREDEGAFAERLRTLAESSKRREAMGLAGRSNVMERYSSDRLRRDMTALYRELLATVS